MSNQKELDIEIRKELETYLKNEQYSISGKYFKELLVKLNSIQVKWEDSYKNYINNLSKTL